MGYRILWIEDDEELIAMKEEELGAYLCHFLGEVELNTALDVPQAVEMLSAGAEYDLVLVDLDLPQTESIEGPGTDYPGVALIRQVSRGECGYLSLERVVVLTAYRDAEIARTLLEEIGLPRDQVLDKPFPAEDLAHFVAEYLEGHNSE